MKVRLRSHILFEIASELEFGRKPYRQEEGGYLAGRFDGETVEIVNYWRDLNAERTAGSIRLREAHLDYVSEEIERSRDPSLYLAGTWHIHPPGYGSQCSYVDAEYLFLDHSLIQAGGLTNARLPQAHLVLSWNALRDYHFYGLQVEIPGLSRALVKPQDEHLHAIETALQRRYQAGILVRDKELRVEPYLGPAIHDAFAAGTLEGFFWFFPYEAIDDDVERVYLANFLHHVRQGDQRLDRSIHKMNKQTDPDAAPIFLPDSLHSILQANLQLNQPTHKHKPKLVNPRLKPKRHTDLVYYRLTRANGAINVSAERLHYSLNARPARAIHVPCQVTEEITVLVANPDTPEKGSDNLGVQPQATVGDIGRRLQAAYTLETPPLLSARRPPHEEQKWRQRTVVDEFGEVLLPDDVPIAELLDGHSSGTVQLSWRSSDLHPDTVYKLRTQRLYGLGYDSKRLAQSTVLVAGLGLLGSEVITLLAAVGVGNLILVDRGVVDFTNIYRQRLYTRKDVYQAKVDVAAQLLSGIGTEVSAHRLSIPTVSSPMQDAQERLSELEGLVARANIVIGALDSFSGRAVLQALCLKNKVPFLSVALDLFDAIGLTQATLFLSLPDRPGCYACGRKLVPARDSGVCTIAPLEFPPIIGGLAFRLIMNILHNQVSSAQAYQIYSNLNIEEQDLASADPQCEICGTNGLMARNDAELYRRIQTWFNGA